MNNIRDYISIEPDVQNGQPVFKGTRVPVDTLFMHLEQGLALDVFLEDFPSVTKEQAVAVLGIAERMFTSKNIAKLYEAAA